MRLGSKRGRERALGSVEPEAEALRLGARPEGGDALVDERQDGLRALRERHRVEAPARRGEEVVDEGEEVQA